MNDALRQHPCAKFQAKNQSFQSTGVVAGKLPITLLSLIAARHKLQPNLPKCYYGMTYKRCFKPFQMPLSDKQKEILHFLQAQTVLFKYDTEDSTDMVFTNIKDYKNEIAKLKDNDCQCDHTHKQIAEYEKKTMTAISLLLVRMIYDSADATFEALKRDPDLAVDNARQDDMYSSISSLSGEEEEDEMSSDENDSDEPNWKRHNDSPARQKHRCTDCVYCEEHSHKHHQVYTGLQL